MKSHIVRRYFVKPKSVFHEWNEDNIYKINQCLDHDFQNWKVTKIKNAGSGYEAL